MIPCGLFIVPIPNNQLRSEAIQQIKQQLFGARLSHTSEGRPCLSGSEGQSVSISHSQHWLVAYVASSTSGAVGVDIEEKADQASRVLERITTEEERWVMARCSVTPLHLWTAKEAVYKAYSDRLSKGITQIFIVDKNSFEVQCDSGEVLLQKVTWLEGDGFVIAHTS